jgi:hypothetical protein
MLQRLFVQQVSRPRGAASLAGILLTNNAAPSCAAGEYPFSRPSAVALLIVKKLKCALLTGWRAITMDWPYLRALRSER